MIVGDGVITFTVTSADCGPLAPPGPEQVRTYVHVQGTRNGQIGVPPLDVATGPSQPVSGAPPLAVQLVAFVVVHESDED